MIPVVGYDGLYEVSADGAVWSSRKRRWLKPYVTPHNGYLRVTLQRGGEKRGRYVHRIVCEAFHGPCPRGHQVAHRNGNRTDNRAENLRWLTPRQNTAEKEIHGTMLRGASHGSTRLSVADVEDILRRLGAGESHRSIAAIYKTTASHVWRIKEGKSWQAASMRLGTVERVDDLPLFAGGAA